MKIESTESYETGKISIMDSYSHILEQAEQRKWNATVHIALSIL